jgi:mono/diheme cytochrome c family protein
MNRPLYIFGSLLATTMLFAACTVDPNAAGVEYMPDMYRSPAPEAYVDYGSNKHVDWTTEQKEAANVQPWLSQKPVPGTIPYTGSAEAAQFVMPYVLNNTPEDYEKAALEIHSPIKSTKVNVEKGKDIYTKMCQHCHGKEGHGDGKISQNGLINGIPDYATKLKDLQEGKMFHTLTYGKGLMGQHASQLNQLQRWQVLEYVKCLQKGISAPEFDSNDMLVIKAAETAAPADTTKKN